MRPGSARAIGQRLLVFVPARRSWPGGARGSFSAATVVDYLLLGPDGAAEAGAAPLTRLPRARALDIVFDALDVFTATVDAPRLGEVKLRQALPNILEERMLGDAADQHFAWAPARTGAAGAARLQGPAGEAAPLSVAAIDRTTLTRVLEALRQASLQPRAAYSELYTVPPPSDGVAHARVVAGHGILRCGQDQGCRFDLDEGGMGAMALVVRQKAISRIRVHGAAARALAPGAAALGLELEDASGTFDASSAGEPVNLLQGAYAATGTFGFSGRLLTRLQRDGAWKAPAAWLGACAVIAIAGLNAYWFKLDSQFQDLRQSMRHAFRDAFPNEPTVVDELMQAQRAVATLRTRAGRPSADDFSVLDAQAVQVFADAPVGIVRAVDYAEGKLVLHFAPGSVDGAALRNALQGRALAQGLSLRFDPDGSARLAPAADSRLP
jgi:general secretion pathway protein L